MRIIATSSLLLALNAAFAQNPTFEVASIKPAAPQADGRIMVRMGGNVPGRLDYANVSLRDLVRQAYEVKDYQVVAPDWLNSTRFDVQAKYPPDTSTATRNLMLQALLAERFGLKIHKESKEASVYNLVVGKNGHKLKKAEENPTIMGPDGPISGPGASDRRVEAPGGPSAAGGGAVAGTRGGGPGGPPPPGGGRGMMMMRIGNGGNMAMQMKSMSMPNFADMLSRQVGKPVFDQTSVEGLYDIDLEFKPQEGTGMMRGLPMPMPRPDGAGPGGGSGPAPDNVEGASIFTAIQDQLGLKLEPKKGPVETIVVDQINKTPTEN
jgi:uncharacterized protein (TIGR03435 family)